MLFTLAQPVYYREEIRKSRFMTIAGPVSGPEQAQAFLQAHGDNQATHNCWAWKCGAQYRSSDDGEPGGTAGRPILSAIEAQGYDRIMVVVTRWYGGIQLGTGGLARAYGGSANKCLQQAQGIPLVAKEAFHCRCTFSELTLVKLRVEEAGGDVASETFQADGVDLRLALPVAAVEGLTAHLSHLSRGRIHLQAL
jgi:uncharacterized YigZ family protein